LSSENFDSKSTQKTDEKELSEEKSIQDEDFLILKETSPEKKKNLTENMQPMEL
jgi:hypothetical protein